MNPHVPVMLSEILDILELHVAKDRAALFIDATLGGGGHSFAILEKYPNMHLVGFDQDECARKLAGERLVEFGDRVRIVGENFSEMPDFLSDSEKQEGACGVLFDLGVSNMQLTTPERGFSYQNDGPLDMRMNTSSDLFRAVDIVREYDERELTRIFRDYGEERHAFAIARSIVRARASGNVPATSMELTSLIRKTLPAPVQRKMGTHPARRVFQALRIAVNSELDVIPRGLLGAYEVTRGGGVIIVISYHSLEDRIVKRTFRSWADENYGHMLIRKPTLPTDAERESNRSSRSAKLRAFILNDIKEDYRGSGGTLR
ncbi:MAG: 16S rRNA (cytosine(1402)-N(4))-methyltransferase RsmH [Synergistaceae bacterium]|jgi:16S rRNA (cytosine1402-N4)-methyltransferase|nr:16S rRNA (cytosine(1402)-N(4))-methyltransferase RsmH [Synergistaceae bacterium]